MDTIEFREFPKIARLSREMIITEKLDGTNAQVFIYDEMKPETVGGVSRNRQDPMPPNVPWLWENEGIHIAAGSRSRWITPEADNFGFAAWVKQNAEQLVYLGDGRHFGEWWGSGIQRGYGLAKGEKRFSLFNVGRWYDPQQADRPMRSLTPKVMACPSVCSVVPVLYADEFRTQLIDYVMDMLRQRGSYAAPGFDKPEGIEIFHTHGGYLFKKTFEKDAEGKGNG